MLKNGLVAVGVRNEGNVSFCCKLFIDGYTKLQVAEEREREQLHYKFTISVCV